MSTEYTQKYEYAREMIRAFLNTEETVHVRDQEDFYSEKSWMTNFFTFNLNQLVVPEVREQADKMLDDQETEQRPYNAALARIRSLYTNMAMALGIEFMKELEANCIQSLMFVADKDRSERGNPYKQFSRVMQEHPELVIAAIGNADFSSRLVNYVHKRNSQSTKKVGTGLVPPLV